MKILKSVLFIVLREWHDVTRNKAILAQKYVIPVFIILVFSTLCWDVRNSDDLNSKFSQHNIFDTVTLKIRSICFFFFADASLAAKIMNY